MAIPNTGNMGEFLCVGDLICLYSVETEGYVYSLQSSSIHSSINVYRNQDKDKPRNIPCAHACVFQVSIQNRYKLNKKYRKHLSQTGSQGNIADAQLILAQHKLAAEAEDADNLQEQRRQMGKKVRYGETIQLKHIFTDKFVHMCTSQTSQIDKNNMMVMLQKYNAKNAQFRLLPQYKVKSEGEVVQIYDQIVFESIKSPGHFLHASAPFQIDNFTFGSEVNLGVERSGLTLVRFRKQVTDGEPFVRGGSVIRLFHKELEAYLVAEGLFEDEVTEDVHFRIRVMDQHRPRTLSPPTSGNTYWTIEAENSIFNGEVLQWEQQIRLRHMPTRKYLCIDGTREISFADDNEDPRTVFRLHSVINERDEIRYESYCRIEHVLTGFWLHALKDEDYIRKNFRDVDNANDQTLKGLRWDSAMVRQVSASGESQYDDAFTIQLVEDEEVRNFNYVAGSVPFLLNFVVDRRKGVLLNAKRTHQMLTAMDELQHFMLPGNKPTKDRQKLLRNLRVIDLMVKILQFPLEGIQDEQNMILLFKEGYEVLYTYMIGKSRKNALYFAKYIEFFQTQFTQKGGIGLNVAQMIVELIRGKRKIVDRISHSQIDEFVGLLQSSQNYRFLDLLHVLCVCDDVAIPNNQTYIVQKWMQCEQKKKGIYLTARGQDINRQPNILYLSTDDAKSWTALHDFVDSNYEAYDKDKHDFLLHQLDLYIALCKGRNDYAINIITKELRYLTWEETFLALRSTILPDSIRAKYCDMTTSLFVDIGNNYSVLAHPNICFIYDYVGSKDEEKSQGDFIVKELVAIFPVLRDWIADFLAENLCIIASQVGHNQLIEQVVRLLYHLVKFGYYMDAEDVRNLLPPLLNLLDGRHDYPMPKDKEKGYSKEAMKKVNAYQQTGRYECNLETEAVINAKFQVLEVLDLLLTYQRNSRLQSFVAKFKWSEQAVEDGRSTVMSMLLYDNFDPHDQSNKALGIQRKVNKELKDMFSLSAIFDVEFLTKVLMDLSVYKYNSVIMKSLNILNKIYSSKMNMFNLASKAQILLTQDSARVHREVLKNMPILRRLSRAKLDDAQVKLMGSILDDLAEVCHLPMTPDEPHPMNQNIMISNGILNVLFDILVQEIDPKLLKVYGGMTDIFKKAFYLLKLLARENQRVQAHIMDRLDIMLDVRVVESDLAIALKEVFCGNQATCLKVSPRQIQKIVNRAADLQDKAPEFLDLLGMVVKVTGTNLTLKRNQAYVMKYIMQNYKKVAFVLDMTREERFEILTDPSQISRLRYYISLLDLLAACAEGENMFIESLCQTILPIDELLSVLNSDKVDNVYKKPFLKCLHHVYLKCNESVMEAGSSEMSHFGDLWDYLATISVEMNRLTDSVKEDPDKMAVYIKTAPEKSGIAAAPDFESSSYGTLLYFLEGVLPFLESFYRVFYYPDPNGHPSEIDETDHIAKAVVLLGEVLGPLIFKPQHMKNLTSCITIIVPISNMPNSNLEMILDRWASGITAEDTSSAIRRGNIEYYSGEVEINAKFRIFTKNCALVFAGHNTVAAQMKIKSNREYTEVGGDEELPLGEEFQSLVKIFVTPSEKRVEKRYEWTIKLIQQLQISTEKKRLSEAERIEADDLNLKCLQVLRAMIHNEERRLPEDWATRTEEPKISKVLKLVHQIQNFYDKQQAMKKILPHLATRSEDVAREVLGFLCIMLFNANSHVQLSMLDYFLSTREEVFFMAVRDRMSLSTNTIKEKRSLQAQVEAQKKKETSKQNPKKQQETFAVAVNAMKQIQGYEDALRHQRLSGWKAKKHKAPLDKKEQKKREKAAKAAKAKGEQQQVTKFKLANGTGQEDSALIHSNAAYDGTCTELAEVKIEVPEIGQYEEEEEEDEDDSDSAQMYRNDGYIELVLKVMARMCDGQNHELQAYLREQPDNLKSFNIILETTQFVTVLYSNITTQNVDLVIQLFECINEFTADYLREQPDNVKSFNIIGEVAQFLNVVYSNITESNIIMITQLFDSVVEFTATGCYSLEDDQFGWDRSPLVEMYTFWLAWTVDKLRRGNADKGNQENRAVIYDNKIIDYINFILRAGDIEDCSMEKVLALRESIANLVVSLIEENGPGKSQVALEVKDTLDKKAVIALMTKCYEHHGIDKKKLEELRLIMAEGPQTKSKTKKFDDMKQNFLKKLSKKDTDEYAEEYEDVGFRLYLILARMNDIDPRLIESLKLNTIQIKAFNYYKKNCMSIEIVKDDELQKVNFRVRSKRVLREEVKEMLKWNVDRSSPSNKIRDLMDWSKDIMKDIAYQRKILSNPVAIVLAKGWLIWNHAVTVLSFAINLLMLLTWDASASLAMPGILPKNATAVPPEIKDPIPRITNLTQGQYTMAIYILGGLHNFFCLLVFLSYFIGNHPRLPDPKAFYRSIKAYLDSRNRKDEDLDKIPKKEHVSKMDAKFLSFATFYYVAFVALSVGGTLTHGYFFAFHLLNIVNNNQLLSGVIKAVTQNGRSLVWVGILGMVVFYLYAIVSFAMMRSMFNPENYLYCDSLWQCTLTVIRYGLIGDLFENVNAHMSEADFHMFGFIVIYHVSFFIFITTIGLNIIFGIIVDTFSELRDLKWTSESDMRDTCFICSRNSYDFEHHGKGFEHHVRQEHNMWAYIFFFIHLNGTKINDYNALEMFVYKLLLKENYDFFPLDRALSLSSIGVDSTETKIDDLLFHVTSIVDKQKREDLEKKRREERMRQKAWEQKHRLGSFRRKAKLPVRASSIDGTPTQQTEDPSGLQQLAIDSPPQVQSPGFSRRPSEVSRRPSAAGYQPSNRHDRYRRRRSVSPMDPRDIIFRRQSPSRGYEEEEQGSSVLMMYDDRVQSPTVFGVESDLLDISPVPFSRRQSIDHLRSPRMSLSAASPRDQPSFFSETDPIPYLRQLSTQYSQERERRLSQTFPEGRPLERYPEDDRDEGDSDAGSDGPPETRC